MVTVAAFVVTVLDKTVILAVFARIISRSSVIPAAFARTRSSSVDKELTGGARISPAGSVSRTPHSGARGGGCDHLNCSHQEGSEREDEDKWAGGDPPFPICGGGGREWPRVIILCCNINSDVGRYGN